MIDHASQLAHELGREMPAPSEHAIETEAQKEGEAAPQSGAFASGPRDRDGAPFNPDIHETDGEGNPVLNRNGTLKKKRGRKSGTSSSPSQGQSQSTIGTGTTPGQETRAAATATAHMIVTLGMMLGGEEWAPRADPKTGTNELSNLEESFYRYYSVKGIRDIPPGLAVTMAVAGYVIPRFFMPKTKSRMQKLREWVAPRAAIVWQKVTGRRNARSDSGNNGKREKHDSEETGAPVSNG